MKIKNIVFDVGNVLVRWDPLSITMQIFPEAENPKTLMSNLFKSSIWYNLNLGKITEREAIKQYHDLLKIDKDRLELLMVTTKEAQLPIPGSIELLEQLHQANYPLYALTDNVKEIIAFLKQRYDFWKLFKGIVVSAEVGFLKPSAAIFKHLLSQYHLHASETLFIDDYKQNVDGAKSVGIKAIQFFDAESCIKDLRRLQVIQ
jgi:putative hydrolase of the HAD superfamily